MPIAPQTSSSGVQTLDRALALLALFTEATPEWSAGCRTHASFGFRSRQRVGYLSRTNGTWPANAKGWASLQAGVPRLSNFVLTHFAQLELRQFLRPVLVRLAHASGETAVLTLLTQQRDSARVVDRVEGNQLVRTSLEIGNVVPLHAGSLGKAILAYMSDRPAVVEHLRTGLTKTAFES